MRIILALISLVWLTVAVNAEVLDGSVCSAADKSGTISTPCTGTVLIGGINTEGAYTRQASIQTLTSVAGSSAITATLAIPLTAYVDQSFHVKFLSDSTGPMTLAISGLPAKPIVSNNGNAIGTGDVRASNLYIIRYYPPNDQFRLINSNSGGSITSLNETTLPVVSNIASWDMSLGADAFLTMSANTTLNNPTFQTLFSRGVLRIKQGATGGAALTLGTSYVYAGGGVPRINTVALSQTEFNYHVVSASGVASIELTPRPNAMLLSATAATTSGTFVDFTGIPSWAKKITVILNGPSTTGANNWIVQIGNSTPETTGYSSNSYNIGAGSVSSIANGFVFVNLGAAYTISGQIALTLTSSNTWIESHNTGNATTNSYIIGIGSKTTSSTVNLLRLTTTTGVDTLDLGSVSILVEG